MSLLTCTIYKHYHHDSRNKLKHKLIIYRRYKNAYSDEKKPKRRERERERNLERLRVKKLGKRKKEENKRKIKKKERKARNQ